MIGAIIGDIVGSRFEFNNYRGTDFELFHKDCSFTDDTICTIAVADWLLNNDGRSLSEIMRQWCRRYPAPAGGYGASFRHWIFSDSGPYNSFGNGSAMRVSPVAWIGTHPYKEFSYEEMLYEVMLYNAKTSARITHDHPEGIKGAQCIADCIYHIRKRGGMVKVAEIAKKKYGYNIDTTCNQIRQTNTFNETCQVTVPQAIVCFLESTDFESAIRLAVSIGGDSDTIAAITGSLAEAYYGIPADMILKAMEYLPEDMVDVIERFSKQVNSELWQTINIH